MEVKSGTWEGSVRVSVGGRGALFWSLVEGGAGMAGAVVAAMIRVEVGREEQVGWSVGDGGDDEAV